MKAIEAVRAEGAIVDRVIAVVDRLEGAAENFKAAGIPFVALLTTADFRLTRRAQEVPGQRCSAATRMPNATRAAPMSPSSTRRALERRKASPAEAITAA